MLDEGNGLERKAPVHRTEERAMIMAESCGELQGGRDGCIAASLVPEPTHVNYDMY